MIREGDIIIYKILYNIKFVQIYTFTITYHILYNPIIRAIARLDYQFCTYYNFKLKYGIIFDQTFLRVKISL